MKNNFLLIFLFILSCQESPKKEYSVLLNKDSDEIVFILDKV